MMLQSVAPLFGNDLSGFLKALALITTPIFAGVLLYLRINSSSRIAVVKTEAKERSDALKADLNGLGERVTTIGQEMQRVRADVDAIRDSISGSHRDILESIRASSEAQLRAVHQSDLKTADQIGGLKVDIARLQEQTNLGETMASFAESISKLAETVRHQT